ncbi:26S proteasome non-ATPase regulatory subunit 2 [Cichlidogyrus casuarinus]|uniref:26S proteasome non-ATPase regulatory subunit 2 n=1 Tax=Cichlidogyrus casuarinus TaxID=1844966 RepID=A0ABD2QNM5_9PLAT
MTAKTQENGQTVQEEKPKNDAKKIEELSEEDIQLRDELNMLVERLQEEDKKLYKPSLESMRVLIRSSTTSMTSVPKPLKFMRDHYETMKEIYEKIVEKPTKTLCADVISVLGMTMVEKPEHKFDTLKYRLLGSHEEIGSWGHEYVRHLSGQVVGMWNECDLTSKECELYSIQFKPSSVSAENKKLKDSYLKLINEMIPYLMQHNAEVEAIDLCMEIENLDLMLEFTTAHNYQRVCLYLVSCVPYMPDPDNTKALNCALHLYKNFKDVGNALRAAVSLNQPELIAEVFQFATSENLQEKEFSFIKNPSSIQRQLSYLLGKQQYVALYDKAIEDQDEDLAEILGNGKLYDHFVSLGRELDIMEPKIPEDVYKSHLENTRPGLTVSFDTMRANLASAYVNGMLNAGFGKEKFLEDESGKEMSWLYNQKEFGKMSAVATLGWIMLWDVDCGLSHIDKYLYTSDDYSRAGALLGCGIVNSGVKNECEPAFALLSPYVENQIECLSRAAIIGLGVAYAGSLKADAISTLTPVVLDTSTNKIQNASLAALSCGMIAVGSLNDEVTSTIIQTMLERPATQWNNPFCKFMALGLALTCLGCQERVDVILASLEAVAEPIRSMAYMMCDFCAYVGTGNVLKVQNLLHILSEKYEEREPVKEEKKKKGKDASPTPGRTTRSQKKAAEAMDTSESPEEGELNGFDFGAHQGLAAFGVAMIAMGEEIGVDMCFRQFGHLLRFSELPIKRVVPLAIALCYVSNPQLKVLDTLSKFSHDSDSELAYNSILALGIVGAGTNNARLAAMLRQLAVYHGRDNFSLFMVRLAQGLTHLGKGTMTLSPYHSDRFLLRPVSIAALLTLMVSCIDCRSTFMGRHDYLMFYLTPAFQPRLLMTFDEDLKPLPVTVRVGQAVDVVGQAGRPKTLTGFQTHTTPVLLGHGERAELATEEYLPVTKLPLEGFVILAKNPQFTGHETV